MNGLNYVCMRNGANVLKFLLDTGATASVIFESSLDGNFRVDGREKIKVQGVAGYVFSLGNVGVSLEINGVNLFHEFIVMKHFIENVDGVLGSDFFTKFSAAIDYEDFKMSLKVRGERICLQLESDYDVTTAIPARCEIIKYLKCDSTEDCVVIPDQICEGVFVAGCISRPVDNYIPIRFLNTNEKEIKIRNFKPYVEPLNFYSICEFDEKHMTVDRIEELLHSINVSNLNKEEKTSIHKICAKYADIFHLKNDNLTVTNVCKQKIILQPGASPAYIKPYRLPHAQKTEINKQIEKLLSDNIIEPSNSQWSAPLLIVPKKTGPDGNKKWRIVIDYRQLNKRIEDDKFPLPCIEEILDSLSGATYFTHLDLYQGYYQLELDHASRPYTSFTSDRGQFQMTRAPMGLKTSPSSFSRAMTIAMSGLNYDICFIYLDDLIVFGNSLEDHNQNLIKVFQRLREVNLKLNPIKCEFLKKEILYLGHVITSKGISPDPEKIRAMQNYPLPKDGKEVKRFVASANYYRKFIPNFATTASPLNFLTRKGVVFQWTAACQNSFETLKQCLISPPILQFPDFSENKQFILKCDASGVALGAILCNDNDRPVSYASRSLNPAEKNYSTIEKELLAIVWAVKKFRPYLYGRKFKIFTDHRPLIYLFGMKNPSSRLTKFRLILEEYDFTVEYIKGKNNILADSLSRITLDSQNLKDLANNDKVLVMTRAKLKATDSSKNNVEDNSSKLAHDYRPDHPGIVELLKKPLESLELIPIVDKSFINKLNKSRDNNKYFKLNDFVYDIENKKLFMKQDSGSTLIALGTSLTDLKFILNKYGITEIFITKNEGTENLIKVLANARKEIEENNLKICIIKDVQKIEDNDSKQLILNDFHILPTGGHAGINRMFNNIRRYYFWPGIKKDIVDYVKRCHSCQKYKHSIITKQPLQITTTASSAFQKVFLDLVGPLTTDISENKYILTTQCELTKFVGCYALPSKETKCVAKAFVENFILQYGIPEVIATDQGTEFISGIFKNTCELLKVKHINSTAYHHESLGSIENTHKHLGAYLRVHCQNHPDSWSSWIQYWCFAYNNTVHTHTKYTPFELVFGKSCKLPSNLLNRVDPIYTFENYPLELKYRLQRAWNDASNNLLTSKIKRKEKLDQSRKDMNFKIGDSVLVRNDAAGNKNDELFKGPFAVLEDKGPNIVIKIGNKTSEIHKNRVKLFIQ